MRGAVERAGGKDIYCKTPHRFDFAIFEMMFREPDITDIDFADQIGVKRDRLRAWRKRGIGFYDADVLCIRLGYHPSLVWGEEYWNPPKRVLKKYRHLIQEESQ